VPIILNAFVNAEVGAFRAPGASRKTPFRHGADNEKRDYGKARIDGRQKYKRDRRSFQIRRRSHYRRRIEKHDTEKLAQREGVKGKRREPKRTNHENFPLSSRFREA